MRLFAQTAVNPDFEHFCLPQLLTILEQSGISPHSALELAPGIDLASLTNSDFNTFPFFLLSVPGDKVAALSRACQESIILSQLCFLTAQGKNYEELFSPEAQVADHGVGPEQTVKCELLSRNRNLSKEEKEKTIFRVLDQFKVTQKVNLKQPDSVLVIAELHSWSQHNDLVPHHQSLQRVFFGRRLCDNKEGGRKLMARLALKNRIYLGPTSTDHELAALMAHFGRVEPGHLVLDPFVGTGSILVGAASRGALCVGVDLDGRVIGGTGVGKLNKKSDFYKPQQDQFVPKVLLNFDQYELPRPCLIRSDCFKLRLRGGSFDAILADPPYGLRAMSRGDKHSVEESPVPEGDRFQMPTKFQIAKTNKEKWQKIDEARLKKTEANEQKMRRKEEWLRSEAVKERVREVQDYKEQLRKKRKLATKEEKSKGEFVQGKREERINPFQIYEKLLDIAVGALRRGGRLVFLYPVWEGFQQRLPSHKGLELVHVARNPLTGGCTRLCVVMRKMI